MFTPLALGSYISVPIFALLIPFYVIRPAQRRGGADARSCPDTSSIAIKRSSGRFPSSGDTQVSAHSLSSR